MRILQRNVKHKITFSLNFTASKTQVPKDSTQSTTFYLTLPKYYLELIYLYYICDPLVDSDRWIFWSSLFWMPTDGII